MSSLCPSSATQTTTTTQGLSPWAQPFVGSMLGAAQQQVFNVDPTTGQPTGIVPYQAYGSAVAGSPYLAGMGPGEQRAAQLSIAGPSQLQQQAYGTAAGMQTPGAMGTAQQAATMGVSGLLGTPSFTTPGAMESYMSPYMQGVVGTQQREAQRQSDIQRQSNMAQAARAGAMGGSRRDIVEAQRQRDLATQMGNIQAQGLQNAYGQAQQQFNTEQQQRINALQGALSGAGQLSNIGQQQLGAQQSIANLQNTLGQQQQTNQQQVINQAMQNLQMQRMYPQQQLQYLSGMLSGMPVSSSGAVTNIPAPSLISQLGGLGLAGAGAYGIYKNLTGGKKGGLPKNFEKVDNRAPAGLAELALSKI